MSPTVSLHRWLTEMGRTGQQAVVEWLQLFNLGASILVLTISPSSYAPANRAFLLRNIYSNTAPILLGFTVLCALVAVVLTRIVVVTAQSYGLSQYALQVVIRVLVLELIPLTAALFVALRCTIPDGAELLALHARGQLDMSPGKAWSGMQREVPPRLVASFFAGITLAALSSVVVLVVTYWSSYGFTVSGLPIFTRLFGQVFSPAVSVIFLLKILFFCLTVSLVPMASALVGMRGTADMYVTTVRTSAELRGLVRMFSLLLLIEIVSLAGNYY